MNGNGNSDLSSSGNSPIASFSCGGFIHGSIWSNIALVTMMAFPIMYLLISFGVHIFIVIVVFVASLFALLRWRSGHMTYSLYDWGFEQYVAPFWGKKQPIVRQFRWEDVLSYQSGIDMSRGLTEYNYLNIKVNKAPHRIQLSDAKGDLDQFLAFKERFVDQVDLYNSHHSSVPSPSPVKHIKQRKDFYKTFWAKLITALFIALSLTLMWYAVTADSIRTSNLFRIVAVIIPGTIYMAYRVFFRKGQ